MAILRNVGWALAVVALVLSYQNCGQTRFFASEDSSFSSSLNQQDGDGQVFDGKLRILHHIVDGFTCENRLAPESILIRDSMTTWHWIQNEKEKCAATESDIDASLIQYDEATKTAIYLGKTYVPPKPYNVLASEDPNLPDVNLKDGVCANANGLCSLRAAVEQALPTSLTEAVIVNLPAGTFLLKDSLKLNVLSDQSKAITIRGSNAQTTILDGDTRTRHFEIRSLTKSPVSLERMTLQNGMDGYDFHSSSIQINADPFLPSVLGTAINPPLPAIRAFPEAMVSISDCVIRSNRQASAVRVFPGSGNLQIHRTHFVDNQFASVQSESAGAVLIENSYLEGNYAKILAGDSWVGFMQLLAVKSNSGAVTVRNSSFSQSYIGIICQDCRDFTIENVTVYQNATAGLDIGTTKYDSAFDATIRNVTVYDNAKLGSSNITLGVASPANSVRLSNSIVAMPTGASYSNCSGTKINLAAINSILSDSSCVSNGSGNITADPLLSTPAQNGGFSPTLLPQAGSPAIDNGSDAVCPLKDQRGLPRLTTTGPAARCDIGAVEMQ